MPEQPPEPDVTLNPDSSVTVEIDGYEATFDQEGDDVVVNADASAIPDGIFRRMRQAARRAFGLGS